MLLPDLQQPGLLLPEVDVLTVNFVVPGTCACFPSESPEGVEGKGLTLVLLYGTETNI